MGRENRERDGRVGREQKNWEGISWYWCVGRICSGKGPLLVVVVVVVVVGSDFCWGKKKKKKKKKKKYG